MRPSLSMKAQLKHWSLSSTVVLLTAMVVSQLFAPVAAGQDPTVAIQPDATDLRIDGTCHNGSTAVSSTFYLVKAAIYCYGSDDLLQFDLTPLNGISASNIVSARLELYQIFAGTNYGYPWYDFRAGAYPNSAPWTLSTNWSTAPSFDTSANYENRLDISNQINLWRTWNVTQAVKDWLSGAKPNYGLRLFAIDEGQNADLITQFAAATYSDPTLRPQLVVQYTTQPVTCVAPPNNLVSWWRAEGNATDAVGGNNGGIVGGVTFAPGKVGQAFNLDGTTGYVEVGDKLNLRFTSALTMEAWIYPTGTPAGSLGIVVGKQGEYFFSRWADGTIRWALAITNPGYVWYNTGIIAPLNIWTHVAVTYNAGVISTYVNGVLVHTFTGSSPIGTFDPNPGAHDFQIGNCEGCGQLFKGLIDEPAVYNRALTAAEVYSIYAADGVGKCVPPPTANAGPNQTVEATSAAGASVTLDGSGSRDPDGDTLTYTWTGTFGTATGINPVVTMPLGTNTVTLKVDDGHGNTASATVQITVQDTTPPNTSILTHPNSITNNATASFSFTGSDLVTPAASLTFQCSLDNGAYAACTSSQSYTITGDGTHSFKVRATDAANNTDPYGVSFTWTLDTTPPTISFAGQNPAANGAGWNNTNVTLTWNCTDALSGVVSPSVTQSLTSEGAGQTATATCTDNAGNSSSNTQTGINIDKTPPTLTFAAAAPAANANGWNNSNVSFAFTASDSLSGVASSSVPSPVVLSTEGTSLTSTVTVTDKAGNSATFTTPAVKIDKTPPTASAAASPGPNANGWNNTNVTVSFSGTDSLSGIDFCSALATLATEGANQSASGTCTDKAGNTSAAAAVSGINIDKTPPTAGASASPGPNTSNWNNTNVVVSFAGTDSLSGIDFCTTPATLSTEGANQSASGTCTDKAGNVSAAATATGINIDKTPPTLTFGAASPAANANGWNNSNVSFNFTASDSLSGVGSTSVPSPVVLSTEGTSLTSTVTVTDKAGNSATFTTPAVKIDKTPPTASASASPGPNANGWNNTNVTVSFSGTDSLSGIDSCSAPTTLSTEGANQSTSGTCTDKAGNTSAAATLSNINIDKTPPTATASASPGPNANNWNNTNVVVSFTGSDSLSGIDSCTAAVTLRAEGQNQSASGTCIDKAGNVSAAATATGINIDKTPPTLTFAAASPAANANSWNNSNVSFTFTASDSLSGVASTSVPSPVVLSAEGAAVTSTVTVTDKAGNTATFTTPAVKIDKTPPTITTSRTPAANTYGWNNSSVSVTFACSDSLSGLAAGSPPAPTTLSGEGANQSVTGSCSDLAGNSASTTVSGINIDLTPPTITFASRTPANSNGWNNTSVTLAWNCADSLSGPVSPSVTQTLANEGAGQSSTGTCTDKAGNSASNTQTNINIDETPPVLNGSVSPNPIVLNGTATASPGGTDSLSGIASQSCGALTTNSVGPKTVMCTATDKAGNTATQTVSYKVLFAAAGLMCGGDVGHTILQPINADGSSVWKTGSTVPAKFRVCDVNGVSVGTGVIANFVLYQINSGTIAPIDETAVNSTNDLGWHFDSTAQQWLFNMSTKTAPQNVANQTYYYRVDLNDGTSIYFQFGLR